MGATSCCCSADIPRIRGAESRSPEPQALAAALSVVEGLVEGEPSDDERHASGSFVPRAVQRSRDSRYLDLRAMRRVLASGDVVLVRGDYVEHMWRNRSTLPRRQQLPTDAVWDVNELFHCLEDYRQVPPLFLALSYGWITEEHPDPQGFHLDIFAPLLQHFAEYHEVSVDKVALFIDWCSLPQQPRSVSDAATYRRAMRDVDLWFAHTHTNVWLLSQLPPEHSAKRPFSMRGWPCFEQALAAMLKPVDQVLDIGLLEFKWKTWVDVVRQCQAPRQPLRVPEHFAHILQGRKFSDLADLQFLLDRYREVYWTVVDGAEEFHLSDLAWGDVDAQELALVLPLCSRLHSLDLHGNQIGTPGALALADVVARCDNLQRLNVTGNCIGKEALLLLQEAWFVAEKDPTGLQTGSQQSERSQFSSLVARQAAFEARFETQVKKLQSQWEQTSDVAYSGLQAAGDAARASNSLLLGQVLGPSWKEELPAEAGAWPPDVPRMFQPLVATGVGEDDYPCDQCCMEWMGLEDLRRKGREPVAEWRSW